MVVAAVVAVVEFAPGVYSNINVCLFLFPPRRRGGSGLMRRVMERSGKRCQRECAREAGGGWDKKKKRAESCRVRAERGKHRPPIRCHLFQEKQTTTAKNGKKRRGFRDVMRKRAHLDEQDVLLSSSCFLFPGPGLVEHYGCSCLLGGPRLRAADHTVVSSAAAHLKRHSEHLTKLEARSLKYLDRGRWRWGGGGGGGSWEAENAAGSAAIIRRGAIRQRETFKIAQELGFCCINTT